MDILLIVLGSLCLLTGLGGCILPMLPGPPIAYVGMLLLHATDKVQFTVWQLVSWLAVVVIIQLLDYFIPMLGVKRFGGTKYGNWGCVAGTVAGMFVFPPWGILLGPFVGAVVGELLGGMEREQAFRAGMGAFLGFLMGTLIKIMVCVWFIICFVRVLI